MRPPSLACPQFWCPNIRRRRKRTTAARPTRRSGRRISSVKLREKSNHHPLSRPATDRRRAAATHRRRVETQRRSAPDQRRPHFDPTPNGKSKRPRGLDRNFMGPEPIEREACSWLHNLGDRSRAPSFTGRDAEAFRTFLHERLVPEEACRSSSASRKAGMRRARNCPNTRLASSRANRRIRFRTSRSSPMISS